MSFRVKIIKPMEKPSTILSVIAGLLFLVFFACLPVGKVFADTGTIDSTNKYAWSNNVGWINFAPTGDSGSYVGATVTDTAITGYAWSQNFGWINLSPTNSACTVSVDCGVKNTTSGVLSGNAWGENVGWINFSGVTISTSTGVFSGTATGTIVGSVNFSCTATGCPVTTTWRNASAAVCGDGTCNGSETCSTCIADCGTCGGGPSHNECNASFQCVSVSGIGDNECTTAKDCEECDPHGDINKDGSIDIVDFSILMYFWHQTNPSNPCADINKDGVVNLIDFSIMLYWWTG